MIEKTFPIAEKLLSNGLGFTQKLSELLSAEFDLLQRQNDPAALATLATGKKELVGQLEQFTKQLSQVLATEKLPFGQEGVTTYLAKAQAAQFNIAPALQTWQQLANLGQKCRSLNEQNGASIELLNRHTQRSLQILRGKSQLTSTYGPDGNTRSTLFSHTLISV